MLIAIVIVFIVRMRGSSGRDRAEGYVVNSQRTIQSSQEVGLVRDLCNESVESIEKNPDIIPQGNYRNGKCLNNICIMISLIKKTTRRSV